MTVADGFSRRIKMVLDHPTGLPIDVGLFRNKPRKKEKSTCHYLLKKWYLSLFYTILYEYVFLAFEEIDEEGTATYGSYYSHWNFCGRH